MAPNSLSAPVSLPESAQQNIHPSRKLTLSALTALILVLIFAATPRLVHFPALYEVRDVDEVSYLSGGLGLWEGVAPTMEMTPAGPQTWISWMYAAARSGYYFFSPDAKWRDQTWKTRPFLAIDTALFKTYEDLSTLHRLQLGVQLLISLCGVYAAFLLGYARGGVFTGIIIGGIVAALPLFVDFAGMTRPYSDAWSFALIALACAATCTGTRRSFWTGLFFGLSVASRIDMFMLVPLVVWELWYRRTTFTFRREVARTAAVTAIVTLLVAPWLLTALVHNLRQIATIRVAGQFPHPTPRLQVLQDLTWGEGMGVFLLATAIGLFLLQDITKWKRLALAALLGLLLATMFDGSYRPMRHHAAVFLTLIFTGALALGGILSRWPGSGIPLVVLTLLIPAFQCFRMVTTPSGSIAVEATTWIEQNVPAGATVYLSPPFLLRAPLPTEKAADAIWKEVTDDRAWRRKFARGLSRFELSLDYTPRALSEVNLVMERGNARRWFMLGGQGDVGKPRFDVRLFNHSPTFWIHDLNEAFSQVGGLIIWLDSYGEPSSEWGEPVMRWQATRAAGGSIYCSPTLRRQIVASSQSHP